MCQLYNMERFIAGNSYKVRDNAQNPNIVRYDSAILNLLLYSQRWHN